MQLTIVKTIFEIAKNFPRKRALLYKKGKHYTPINYKELVKRVSHFSSALLHFGIQKGDRVGILSHNCPEWVVADLGAQHIGAITVPIHTTYSSKIIAYILHHSGATILVVSDKLQLEKILERKDLLPELKKIIIIETEKEREKGDLMISWQRFMKIGKKASLTPPQDVTHQDTASIVYTSGTTGLPKGVVLTHYNFLSNIQAALSYIPVQKKDIFLSFLPLSHILERTAGYYCPLSRGATIAYAENMKMLPKNLKEVKPTILISVPRIFEKMYEAILEKVNVSKKYKKRLFAWALKQNKGTWQYRLADKLVFKKIRKSLGGKFRLTISGGASLNENLAKFFYKIGVMIYEGYGLTETSPVISVNKENKYKFGSVGIALPGIELKISDDKEILVRGPNVMQGYYKDKPSTDAVIDEGGWFHTGDLGFMDAHGFLFIIGRRKEMYVTSGGKNIWPQVIEKTLNQDPSINQSMVIAHNRKYVTALIVPQWNETIAFAKKNNVSFQTTEDVIQHPVIIDFFSEKIQHLVKDFPDYEKIIKFVLIPNEFSHERDELTPTLKLRRETIIKHYEREIEMMYREPKNVSHTSYHEKSNAH